MKRPDGIRVRNEDLMYTLIPNFLCTRTDSMNSITEYLPVEPMKKYMNDKRKEDIHISYLAIVICAYMMAAAKYPCINRFIVNRRIFQRNEFCVSMVVLRPGSNDDTMSKIYFDPEKDTIFDVQRKLDEYVDENRVAKQDNKLDKAMKILDRMQFLVRVAINLLRWMDKHNLLPKALIDVSPFHASFLISNLASIRTNHIYHHVYEFGTTSVSITMGNMVDVPKNGKNGIELEKHLPLGIVMDERICSGHYFAQVFSYIKSLASDPVKMETPFENQK